MKISNTATAVRVTLSPTEISDLQFVIEAAEGGRGFICPRAPTKKSGRSPAAPPGWV